MSDKQLTKIEKLLDQVCEAQGEICSRIEALEGRLATLSNAPTKEETIAMLDGFRANECFAAEWIGSWIENSDLECVRGGLRTVQQREAAHAHLLEARIAELGGKCEAEVPASDRDMYLTNFAGDGCTDVEKIGKLVEMLGEGDSILKPLCDFTDRLSGDQETQFLMTTILQDERSTIQFLRDACELLSE